jgi:hypothetical protein
MNKRKLGVGDAIYTTTIRARLKDGSVALYWIGVPDGMTNEQAAETQKWHGPFKTEAEVNENQRVVLLGPQCKVTHGATWDPNWIRPQ